MNQRTSRRLLCSLLLFALVFVLLGSAVDTIWFREDDLGTILGGIIRSWHDLIRVFSADCRSLITPCNYLRTEPNVISGFLRPMQNAVFSIVYYFWGVDARAYYLVHVALHAANAALLCTLLSYWLPVSLSFSAGLMLAFYPSVSWLTWIGTVQNSLAVLFALLAVIFYRHMTKSSLLAGLLFLASLLSRETTMLLPLWFLLGAYWFGSVTVESDCSVAPAHTSRYDCQGQSLEMSGLSLPPIALSVLRSRASKMYRRVRSALITTAPIFVAGIIYCLMRLASFGVATLPRTINNALIRFPWLAQYVGDNAPVTVSSTAGVPMATDSIASIAFAISDRPECATLWRVSRETINALSVRLTSWLDVLLNLPALGGQHHVPFMLALTALLTTFLWRAYRGQRRLLLWLSFGLGCTLWPGVLAYPSPRYLNLSYPFVVALVVVGVYLAWQQRTWWLRVAAGAVLTGALALTMTGAIENRRGLCGAAAERFAYKQNFADFFARHHFPPKTQFVVLSSPFVSDVQHIFQAFTNNPNTQVVFDPFCTLAERGIMGCREDYRTVGVASVVAIEPLALSAGQSPAYRRVRLISADPAHCGWWLRFSDYPIRWVASTRSYEWTTQQYRPGRWYPCSIGTFFVHAMTSDDCVTDITFAIDSRWITPDTVFVAWNTTVGRYDVVGGNGSFEGIE